MMTELSFESALNFCPARLRTVLATSGSIGYANGECWFGVPHDAFSCGMPMTRIPDGATHFHFLLGGNAVPLLEAFSRSRWAATAETLTLGSSDAQHTMHYDYRNSVRALAAGHYPALTRLELGIFFSQANGHSIHGEIGDPALLLAQCPNMRHLTIRGSFALHSPLCHTTLETLDICVEDPMTGVNGPPLAPSTLEYLRAAQLPCLRESDIDLHSA